MLQVLESSIVVPSEEAPKHMLWLSNLDLKLDRFHTALISVYRPAPNGEPSGFFSSGDTLIKEALRKALVHFYPLAGRLVVDHDGRIAIDCNGEGVVFVVARSPQTLNDFGDFAPSSSLREMLVPSADSPDPPCILLMIQLTYFSCGGVTIGYALHHTAMDGHSFFQFAKLWTNFARGTVSTSSQPLPFHDCTIFRARSPPTVTFDHRIQYAANSLVPIPPSPNEVSAILKLSPNQVTFLKHKCSGGNKQRSFSTFQTVVSHTWRSVCIARGLSDSTAITRVYVIGDVRGRMNPPIPLGYVGNALCRTTTEAATAADIVSRPPDFAAGRIRDATVKLKDYEYVRSAIDFIEVDRSKGKWVLPHSPQIDGQR